MTALVSNLIVCKGRYIQFVTVASTILVAALAAFPDSYLTGTNFLIGLVLFPFVLVFHGNSRVNYVYFGVSLLFAGLAFYYEVKMFYFVCLCFTLLGSLEFFFGRVNTLVLFLIGAMSPAFQQVAGILGFPIRIKLSQAAGTILQMIGLNVSVDGNLITLDGSAFTVDEACMGLNMLAIAILLAVFLLATEMKRAGKTLSFFYVSVFFVSVFALNIVANLFRILTLVLFRIGAEDFMHEAMGIAALLIYCILPATWLSRILVRWKGRGIPLREVSLVERKPFVTLLLFCIVVMSVGFTIDPAREARMDYSVEVSGMQGVAMKDGMIKFADEASLIYVKTIPEFFSGEHTPLFCWKGSGYEFKKIARTAIGNQTVYSGIMTKGDDRLHTAWWYTNGEINTIDQLTWRYASLKTGNSFCLVNVTACDEQQLMDKVNKLFGGELKVELQKSGCL